jgi:indolepyruvate ferredoxin oxidoreductase
VSQGEAAALVAFDQLVAASDPVIGVCDPHRTVVVASTETVPTGSMIGHPEVEFPADQARGRLEQNAAAVHLVDAANLAEAITGTAATANIVILGAACQLGAIPVRPESFRRAIELNGVAVDANLAAFEWGRAAVSHSDLVAAEMAAHRLATGALATVPPLPEPLKARIESWDLGTELTGRVELRAADLVGYQDVGWANRFLAGLEPVVRADDAGLEWLLTKTAADSLHKLMAYKDEFEVARLMLLPEADAAARRVGGSRPTMRWLLHPPVLAAVGVDRKLRFGRWSKPFFRLLAAAKVLRGTWADPFGRFEMRRLERAMIPEFERALATVATDLDAERYPDAVALAALPQQVRGFEALKFERAAEYRKQLAAALNSTR